MRISSHQNLSLCHEIRILYPLLTYLLQLQLHLFFLLLLASHIVSHTSFNGGFKKCYEILGAKESQLTKWALKNSKKVTQLQWRPFFIYRHFN